MYAGCSLCAMDLMLVDAWCLWGSPWVSWAGGWHREPMWCSASVSAARICVVLRTLDAAHAACVGHCAHDDADEYRSVLPAAVALGVVGMWVMAATCVLLGKCVW